MYTFNSLRTGPSFFLTRPHAMLDISISDIDNDIVATRDCVIGAETVGFKADWLWTPNLSK